MPSVPRTKGDKEDEYLRKNGNSDIQDSRHQLPKATTEPGTSDCEARKEPDSADNDHFKISSLNFERIVNEYSIQATLDSLASEQRQQQQHQKHGNNKATASSSSFSDNNDEWFHYTKPGATRWFLSILVGILSGTLAIGIVEVSNRIVDWRMNSMEALSRDATYSTPFIFGLFCLVNLALSTTATLLCIRWAPQGAGSGIPEIMAYLNGVRVHFDCSTDDHFASVPLLLVKMMGTILAVSSFLAIGMEGPLIHMGAIVGAGCTKLFAFLLSQSYRIEHLMVVQDNSSASPATASSSSWWCCRPFPNPIQTLSRKLWMWTTMNLSHFATDHERRDLVSIGASCGFAASFGAPIGGLLFILDDISSHLTKDIFFRCLVVNALGTFLMALHSGSLSNYSVIGLQSFLDKEEEKFSDHFIEIPLYVIVGIGGGLLGGFFCHAVTALRNVRASFTRNIFKSHTTVLQLAEVMVLSLITSTILFYLPSGIAKTCKEVGQVHAAAESAKAVEPNVTHLFFCKPGEVNEIATLLLGSRNNAIKRILSDPSAFERMNLLGIGVVFYILVIITFGVSIPSGIFTPIVLAGSSFGGVVGDIVKEYVNSEIHPRTFAVIGTASLLAGIQRSTVSVCVILVESTGQVKLLLPVIITVVVSRHVSELIAKEGVFEMVMRWKELPYLEHSQDLFKYDAIRVRDVMHKPVITVSARERVTDLVVLLRESTHNGFPVVDIDNNKKLLGLVRRDQIIALIESGVLEDENPSSSSESLKKQRKGIPRPGVINSHLMHMAFHISDDRFEHVDVEANDDRAKQLEHNKRKDVDVMTWGRNKHQPRVCHHAGETDLNHEASPLLTHVPITSRQTPISIPSSPKLLPSSTTSQVSEEPEEIKYATVSQNKDNNHFISWLNPEIWDKFANLSFVMNQGAYGVTEFCPLSKARTLFTELGLRHIVVLGGSTGGEVVGVLTRASFISDTKDHHE